MLDSISLDWLTAIVLGVIAGGLIGWVFGHKMKKGQSSALSIPIALQYGPTGNVIIFIGLSLIILTFFIGIWQGMVAIIIAYMTNSFIGSKVMSDKHGDGLGKFIKTTFIILLVVILSFIAYQYNRSPNEQDRLAFIYECDEYLANSVFEADDGRNAAKAVCSCLWPDLVGRYKSMGLINTKARNGGKVSVENSEVNKMALTCLRDYQNGN